MNISLTVTDESGKTILSANEHVTSPESVVRFFETSVPGWREAIESLIKEAAPVAAEAEKIADEIKSALGNK